MSIARFFIQANTWKTSRFNTIMYNVGILADDVK